MKKIIFLMLLFISIGCRKDFSEVDQSVEPQSVANKVVPAQEFTLGDPNRTPNGYVVYNDIGWISSTDQTTRMGIMAKDPVVSLNAVVSDRDTAFYGTNNGTIKPGDIVDYLSYDCPIANAPATSGQPYSPYLPSTIYGDHSGADMVVDISKGTPVLGGSFRRLEEMLGRELFISEGGFAVPINGDYKLVYEKTNTHNYWPTYNADFENRYREYPAWGPKYYDYPYYFVHPGKLDFYRNKLMLKKDTDGEYAAFITFNPKGKMRESNYDDNTSVLHFNKTGATAIRNFGDFSNFQALPVNSVSVHVPARGKKVPIITWDCPYHGTGIWHSFKITRHYTDGRPPIVLVDDLTIAEGQESTFTDSSLPNREKAVIYTVEVKLRNNIFPISPKKGVTFLR